MIFNSRALLLAAGLMTAPMTLALAQQGTPNGNMGNTGSTTASPGSNTASGMNTSTLGSHTTGSSNYGGASMANTTPGATGHTVVPGSNSSQASAAGATREQKSGSVSGTAQ